MKKRIVFTWAFIIIFAANFERPLRAQETIDTQAETVEIEKPLHRKKNCNCTEQLEVPYTERRTHFGGTFGFQWGSFSPTNYQPAFNTANYTSYYGGQSNGTIEMAVSAKWNFFFGSIGPHFTAGYFSAQNQQNAASLWIIPVTGGIMYALDNIFKEPYIVPYVIAGMYTGIYNESQQGLSVKGNTAFAPFYSVGAMFQLDALDKEAHDSGYEDFGIENTFIYAEGRSFLQAQNTLPDISTPLQLFAGLRVEF